MAPGGRTTTYRAQRDRRTASTRRRGRPAPPGRPRRGRTICRQRSSGRGRAQATVTCLTGRQVNGHTPVWSFENVNSVVCNACPTRLNVSTIGGRDADDLGVQPDAGVQERPGRRDEPAVLAGGPAAHPPSAAPGSSRPTKQERLGERPRPTPVE